MPKNPWETDKDFDLSLNISQAKSKPWETDTDFEGAQKPFGEDKIPVSDIARMVGRGIPIAGRYIDETPEMKGYAQRHPWTAKGLEFGGTAASTIPLALGAATLAGPGLAAGMAAQGVLGAGLTLADRAAQKGISGVGGRDLIDSLFSGGVSSLGPLGGRILSPKLPPAKLPEPTALERAIAARGGKIPGIAEDAVSRALPPKIPGSENTTNPLMDSVISGLRQSGIGMIGGSVVGEAFGHGPLGAITGAALPFLKEAGKAVYPHWVNNSVMNSPMNQAILAAIAQKAGSNLSSEDEPIQ